MAPEQYAQEFECSFESALIGSYYGSYLETAQAEDRLTRVPWEPSVPVHTAWDLGVSDATAIWFVQPVGRMLHVIDYLEASRSRPGVVRQGAQGQALHLWPPLLSA